MSLLPQPAAAAHEMWLMHERIREHRCALWGQVRALDAALVTALAGIDDPVADAMRVMSAKRTREVLRLLSEAGFHDGGYA